ncbi:MAG: HEAT repeat domain-containing protein [Deferribacteraceae bacterium]|nr:HEAT repeat domain-containing protein [Deferribacteraceae bacterium]
MFEGLDKINWKKLHHAYGSAEDVPDLLHALASQDSKARKKAYYELWGNIYHQGSVWQASPYTISFLYELIAAEDTPDKEDVINYILYLATGEPDYYLPFGMGSWESFDEDYKNWQAKRESWLAFGQAVSTKDEDKRSYNSDEHDNARLDCYFEAAQGVPILIKASYSADEDMRVYAVWALAYFPRLLNKEAITRICELAKAGKTPREQAGALFALSMISYQMQNVDYLPIFEELFKADDIFVKTAAAVGIIIVNGFEDGQDAVLFIASLSPEAMEEIDEHETPFCGEIASYISAVLELAGKDDVARILPNMAASLQGITEIASVGVTSSILALIEKANPQLKKPYTDFAAFNSVSQAALRAIAEYGGWQLGGSGVFVNYISMIRSWGYPDSWDEFKKFVGLLEE